MRCQDQVVINSEESVGMEQLMYSCTRIVLERPPPLYRNNVSVLSQMTVRYAGSMTVLRVLSLCCMRNDDMELKCNEGTKATVEWPECLEAHQSWHA
jgi:hypothetical protein